MHSLRPVRLGAAAGALPLKAPVSLVRCSDRDVCSQPEEVPGGRIIAPLLGTREAMLLWGSPPSRVLLVKKWRDPDARDAAVEVGDWLADEFGVELFVYEDEGEDEGTQFPERFARYLPPSCNAAGGGGAASGGRDVISFTPSARADGPRTPAAAAAVYAGSGGGGYLHTTAQEAHPPLGTAAGDDIDLIVSVGGDGTVLHISGLFQAAMPPVVAIAFGSLGFMTVHSLNSCTDILSRILSRPSSAAAWPAAAIADAAPSSSASSSADSPADGGAGDVLATRPMQQRHRVDEQEHVAAAVTAVQPAQPPLPSATPSSSSSWLSPAPTPSSGAVAAAGSSSNSSGGAREAISVSLRMRLRVDLYRRGSSPSSHRPELTHVVLNELLLERGPSPYMATLNAYVDDEPLTTVAADGLIVATQTGSTAYSLSAGGSILSPNTAAIVFTPICPHTLSFRPLLFPDSAVIRLEVPPDARSSAMCSFDGRHSIELRAGDYVLVRSSPFPLPLVCRRSATGDWVRAIKCKLYWNVRERQKAFKRPPPTITAAAAGAGAAAAAAAAAAPTAHAAAAADGAAVPAHAPPSHTASVSSTPAQSAHSAAPSPPLRPVALTLPPGLAGSLPAAAGGASDAASAAAAAPGGRHFSPPGSPTLPASRRQSDAVDAFALGADGGVGVQDLDDAAPSEGDAGGDAGAAGAAASATAGGEPAPPPRKHLLLNALHLGADGASGGSGAGSGNAPLPSTASSTSTPPLTGISAVAGTPSFYIQSPNAFASSAAAAAAGGGGLTPNAGAAAGDDQQASSSSSLKPARSYRFINPPSSTAGGSAVGSIGSLTGLANGSGTARSSRGGAPGNGSAPPSPLLAAAAVAGAAAPSVPPVPSPLRGSGGGSSSLATLALPPAAAAAAAAAALTSAAPAAPAPAPSPAPAPQLPPPPPPQSRPVSGNYHFLGSSAALDYPDAIEFDSETGIAHGVTLSGGAGGGGHDGSAGAGGGGGGVRRASAVGGRSA